MAKKDKGKRDEREIFVLGEFRRSIDIIPEPKGKVRNLFAARGMIPKPKRAGCCAHCVHCPHCTQSVSGAAKS